MFTVRNMRREDMRHTFDWSVEEGWNIGQNDYDCFYAADPNGFFVGESDGEPVGSVSGVAYDDHFGFIGIYIVSPKYRGMGYGLQLFQAAMAHLGDRNIGLDGVIAQQANYQKLGFKTAYRNIRYGGIGKTDTVAENYSDCKPLALVPFTELNAYDRHHFPAPRPNFLECWRRQPEATGFGLMRGNRLAGYAMIRPSTQGHLIAPLFADDPQGAEILFEALACRHPGEPIFIDVPEPNREGIALAERHGMTPVFETARMYTKQAPDLPLHEIYVVTTLELG